MLQAWAWKESLDFGYPVEGSLSLIPPVTEKTRFVN
jgi:peptide/nickel transport system substrate-binding protein